MSRGCVDCLLTADDVLRSRRRVKLYGIDCSTKLLPPPLSNGENHAFRGVSRYWLYYNTGFYHNMGF